MQPGSIVLFHNAALHTPEALPGILEALLQEGYTFVPISELILPGEYTELCRITIHVGQVKKKDER